MSKKNSFILSFIFATSAFAESGNYDIFCQVHKALATTTSIFTGELAKQSKKPVTLVEKEGSGGLKMTVSYVDSGAAGPFDLLSFQLIEGDKVQELLTIAHGTGVLSSREMLKGVVTQVIECEFGLKN